MCALFSVAFQHHYCCPWCRRWGVPWTHWRWRRVLSCIVWRRSRTCWPATPETRRSLRPSTTESQDRYAHATYRIHGTCMYMHAICSINLESMCVRHLICKSACDMTLNVYPSWYMSFRRAAKTAPTIWNHNLVSCRDVQNTIESTSSQ